MTTPPGCSLAKAEISGVCGADFAATQSTLAGAASAAPPAKAASTAQKTTLHSWRGFTVSSMQIDHASSPFGIPLAQFVSA